MENVPTDLLVKAYIKMRDKRKELSSTFKDADDHIKEQMEVIEATLLEVCKATGADSIKTALGTVMKGVKTNYWTSDWGSMYEFIKENDSPELLERRVSQSNMKEFLKNNPDKMPKGLNIMSEYSITVRRAS
jgi:hypothetical protein